MSEIVLAIRESEAMRRAADALRRYESNGKKLLSWERISASQRKKWLNKAIVAVETFRDAE